MKAVNLEIVKDGDFDGVSRALLSDKTSVRFSRRRAYDPATTDDILPDTATRGMFEQPAEKGLKTHNKWGMTFAETICGVAVLWLVFFALVGTLVWYVTGNVRADGFFALIIAFACLTGTASAVLTAFLAWRGAYIKRTFYRLDDLYLLYGKNPCAVEVRGGRVRILCEGALYTVKRGKTKITRKPLNIYRASLNMYPQSALDIKSFVNGLARNNVSAEFGELCASTGMGDNGIYLSLNVRRNGRHNVAVRSWGVRKFLYELDADLNLKTVYSAVTESLFVNYCYVTRAEVTARGDTVLRGLTNALVDFPQAQKILDGIMI